MMGVITLVTDRLRRTESIMIMILMIDLCKCMSACVRQSSAGDVSPHTGSRSPVPSVLPARTHTRNSHTRKHNQVHLRGQTHGNRTRKMLLEKKKKSDGPNKGNKRVKYVSAHKDRATISHWMVANPPLPRMLSCQGSAKGKAACVGPLDRLEIREPRVCMWVL